MDQPRQSSRREFFKASLMGTAAATTTLITPTAEAAKPPKRNGHSHMKLSLAGYSFNRFLQKSWTPDQLADAKMTYDDFFDFCAEHDFDGCEPTAYYFPKDVTNEYLMHVKEYTFRLGLDISGTAIGNDFCLPEGEGRDKQLKMCRDWIDRAALMGAPVIRIFAGKVPKGDNEDAAIERCIAGIDECLAYAATKGVFLALENHGGITATPVQMMRIIDGVKDSAWFGVNLDGGNFRTDDPYRDLAVIAPYAINAQVKVKVSVNGKHEPADLGRVIKILRDADYRGYVVLEYEEKEPHKEIPMYAKKLRDLSHG